MSRKIKAEDPYFSLKKSQLKELINVFNKYNFISDGVTDELLTKELKVLREKEKQNK